MESRLRWFENVERIPLDSLARIIHQIKRIQIVKGRRGPRKTIRKNIKKYFEINDLNRSIIVYKTYGIDLCW